jgi:hypothetical protein
LNIRKGKAVPQRQSRDQRGLASTRFQDMIKNRDIAAKSRGA